jgi:hypothetical protein
MHYEAQFLRRLLEESMVDATLKGRETLVADWQSAICLNAVSRGSR